MPFFLPESFGGGDCTIDVIKQFRHRIVRLYPQYIAVLVVAVLYALLKKAIPYDVITHLLCAQNIQWMVTGYSSVMQPMTAHTWTLSIEVLGGLVWLFLLRNISKERFCIVMWGMLILGVVYRTMTILLGCNVWIVSLCPIAHFDAFALGSLLAIKVRVNKVTKRVVWGLSLLGLGGILASIFVIAENNQVSLLAGYKLLSSSKNYLGNWFTGNIYLFISWFAVGIVGLLFLHDESTDKPIGVLGKLFVALGDNSYAFYLFHWPVLVILQRFIENWWITFPVVFVVTVVAAIFFDKVYSLVQSRCWRRKRT